MARRPRSETVCQCVGAGGTIASCAITMVVLPLALAGTAASAAIHAGGMAGMGGTGGAAGGNGTLAGVAQGLLILSLPLVVIGLWRSGWSVRLLASGSGGALYASMYVVPSAPLFGAAGAGVAASYLWAWRKRRR